MNSCDPEIVILRFTRLVFGVLSSTFLLNANIKHHVEKYSSSHPEIVKLLIQSIYVASGADHEGKAYTLYQEFIIYKGEYLTLV